MTMNIDNVFLRIKPINVQSVDDQINEQMLTVRGSAVTTRHVNKKNETVYRNYNFKKRQAQEELLRKRLAEMNMEAKELKRKERLSRLGSERDGSPEGSVSNYPNVASAYSGLQALENGGRLLDREFIGAAGTSAAVLPEQLPEADFEQDWSKITGLEGVDLLREHRSQKERLQLPPVVDPTTKIERRKARSTEKPQANGYIPSSLNDVMRRSQNYRQQAETILRAPLDDEITYSNPSTERSAVSLPPPQRSRSPVLPAVRTESMLKRNSRILDDKWKVISDCTMTRDSYRSCSNPTTQLFI